jgi:peptidoglycan-N-acetylglucosamine deacetylase
MYLVKTPPYLKRLLSGLTWEITGSDEVYLTFDDGPVPGVTDKVLDLLRAADKKATFFCIGDNVRKSPALYQRILDEGHRVGNHTYHHVNGWRTSTDAYVEDAGRCAELVNSGLFRPPYGRITLSQFKVLQPMYKVIMWDVLSGDFDEALDAAACTRNVLENYSRGSIIVFNDSEKAAPRMLPALEAVLQDMQQKNLDAGLIP